MLRISLYSGKYLPAWRMNQKGTLGDISFLKGLKISFTVVFIPTYLYKVFIIKVVVVVVCRVNGDGLLPTQLSNVRWFILFVLDKKAITCLDNEKIVQILACGCYETRV